MIQNRAMLVTLTINKWTATKHDKAVSTEVERAHAAHDAGRYNKRLIDKAHLATIDTLAGQLRQFHYSRTLPWADEGQRLLPSDLFLDYQQELHMLKLKFQTAVQDFLVLYPQLVQDARTRLGTMYAPDDYPELGALKEKFGVKLEISPVPTAADFRVDVAEETRLEIQQQITEAVEAKQQRAMKDCWARVREVVGRIAEQCGKEKGRIHDSLMDNARDLVSVLSGLNITNDPALTAVEAELRALIVSPYRLRVSPSARAQAASSANSILAALP